MPASNAAAKIIKIPIGKNKKKDSNRRPFKNFIYKRIIK